MMEAADSGETSITKCRVLRVFSAGPESKVERVGIFRALDVKGHICRDRRRCYRGLCWQPIP